VGATRQVAFRLPKEVIEAMDAKAEQLTRELCFTINRTNIAEAALRKYCGMGPAMTLPTVELDREALDFSTSHFLEGASAGLRNCLRMDEKGDWVPAWGPKPHYVGQLVQLREADLRRIRLFGEKKVEELTERLAVYGLTLGMDLKDWEPPEDER
jgi:hypothetical protein